VTIFFPILSIFRTWAKNQTQHQDGFEVQVGIKALSGFCGLKSRFVHMEIAQGRSLANAATCSKAPSARLP
jgi:hypothetical protein